MYAYFNYKKPLVQPGIALGYGWGSRRQSEQKKLDLLRARRLKNPRLVTVINDESISDLSLLLSLRHDFIWQQIFGKRDLFAITPVAMLSCGTQNFGFNTSFQSHSKAVSNFLPANQYIQDKRNFDTQSSSIVVKADYSAGIFFLQSQVLFDYYLHSADNRLNNAFAVIAGVNF